MEEYRVIVVPASFGKEFVDVRFATAHAAIARLNEEATIGWRPILQSSIYEGGVFTGLFYTLARPVT